MTLGADQGRALTALIHALRPAWNEGQITDALLKVRDRDPFEVALAAIRAAQDPKAQFPAVIPSNGPHWNELPPTAPKAPRLSREERRARTCAECGRLDGCTPECPGFLPLDQAAAKRSLSPAEVRAELEATLATLCTHHVNRSRWRCEPCDQADKPAPKELTTNA